MTKRHLSLLALPFLIAAACSSDPAPSTPPDPGKPTPSAPARKDAGGVVVADAAPVSPDSATTPASDAGPAAPSDANPAAQPDAPVAPADAGADVQPPGEATLSTCKDIMASATAFSESLEPAKKTTALLPFDA